MTEKGKAYQLGIKQANRDCALAKLKRQIEKINIMRDLPETTIEQLALERDYLDRFWKMSLMTRKRRTMICWNRQKKKTPPTSGSIFVIESLLNVG